MSGRRISKYIVLCGTSLSLAACFLQPASRTTEPASVTEAETVAADPAPRQPVAREENLEVAILDPEDSTAGRVSHLEMLAGNGNEPLEGGDAGYYMDIQEARLRQRLGSAGAIKFERQGNSIVVAVAAGAMFASNSYFLRKEVQDFIAPLAEVLAEYNKTQVSIYGHTDALGDEEYNRNLSEKRAVSVAQFLVDAGIARERIVIVGYGESRPVATNETAAGRELNRRVEFEIQPITR